jgi:hypothetical protein
MESNDVKKTKPIKDKKTSKFTLNDIKKQWPEVIKQSQKDNHSLPMTLKIAHILTFDEIDSNTLELGFEFDLHVKRLEEPKIKEVLEGVLKKVYDSDVSLTARILTQEEIEKYKQLKSKKETEQEKKLIDEVMDVFGSELATE